MRSTIITNPVNINVEFSQVRDDLWKVTPSLTAFSVLAPPPKNIIFVLDNSLSMGEGERLPKVKEAVSNLLDKLTPIDTFSIVSFNKSASYLVTRKLALPAAISAAKANVNEMKASGGTNFEAAFEAVNIPEIIPSTSHSTIIFLTDGEDTSRKSSAELLNLFHDKKEFLDIIPIGVFLGPQARNFLDQLFTVKGKKGKAIYVADVSSDAYNHAFEEAFKLAMQQSQSSAQLELTIEAKDETNFTHLEVKRELTKVVYDGQSSTTTSLTFNSTTPPCYFKLHFHCDDTSLQAEHMLTPAECKEIANGRSVIAIPTFKWKDNTTYSWIRALGSTAMGLLILVGVAIFAFSLPALSLGTMTTWAMIPVSLLGLYLFIRGGVAIGRKTAFLPTKSAVGNEMKETKDPMPTLSGREEKRGVPHGEISGKPAFFEQLKRCFPQFPSGKRILAGSALVASGAAAGYFAGIASAASVGIATGINASLFVTVCAVGGAVVLPLLAYGCWQLYLSKMKNNSGSAKKSNRSQECLAWLPSKKLLAGSTLAAGGAVAGYFAGTASAASGVIATGISASLFVTVCAVGGAIVLPLLAYGCMQLNNTCTGSQPTRRRAAA